MVITLYTLEGCTWSDKAREFLNSQNIPYIERNVSANEEFIIEIIMLTGAITLPIVYINGVVITGFDQIAISTALREQYKSAQNITQAN